MHERLDVAIGLPPDLFAEREVAGDGVVVVELIAGPMLALGLFTRLACVPLVLFLIVTNFERWRVGRYFWNKLGVEYTLMWLVATFYFLIHGGGLYSLDHLIGREF